LRRVEKERDELAEQLKAPTEGPDAKPQASPSALALEIAALQARCDAYLKDKHEAAEVAAVATEEIRTTAKDWELKTQNLEAQVLKLQGELELKSRWAAREVQRAAELQHQIVELESQHQITLAKVQLSPRTLKQHMNRGSQMNQATTDYLNGVIQQLQEDLANERRNYKELSEYTEMLQPTAEGSQ